MSLITVTTENYDELTRNNTVLLDFWAEWCGPCRMVAPIVEEIAKDHTDLIVGKVDVDTQMALATRFGITSIPTLILMDKGEAVKTLVGFRPKADILKQLGL